MLAAECLSSVFFFVQAETQCAIQNVMTRAASGVTLVGDEEMQQLLLGCGCHCSYFTTSNRVKFQFAFLRCCKWLKRTDGSICSVG